MKTVLFAIAIALVSFTALHTKADQVQSDPWANVKMYSGSLTSVEGEHFIDVFIYPDGRISVSAPAPLMGFDLGFPQSQVRDQLADGSSVQTIELAHMRLAIKTERNGHETVSLNVAGQWLPLSKLVHPIAQPGAGY